MPKFKILIVDNEDIHELKNTCNVALGKELSRKLWGTPLGVDGCTDHFETRDDATRCYNDIVLTLEHEVNRAKLKLHAVVENGHIVEVEEDDQPKNT